MKFIKVFVAALLFVATGVSVMAADYAAFGGKGVDYRTLVGNLKLTHKGDGVHDLELDVDVAARLKKVDSAQFSKEEKAGGGPATYKVSGNVIAFMKDFYAALETAAGEVSTDSGEVALAHWLGSAKPASKKLTVNLKNRTTSATLISDNAAKKAELQQRVRLEILDASDTAVMLGELNGTHGALRPAKGAYDNVQAAYDAYQAAKSRGDAAAARAVLVNAEALKIGSNNRNLLYLADKEKRADRTTAEMRAAKAKVGAKVGGGRPEDKISINAFARLLQAVEDGHFAPLTPYDRGLAADFDEALTEFPANASKAGRLIDVLVAFAKDQRVLKNEITLLQQAVAAAKAAALEAASKGRASSGGKASGGLGGHDSGFEADGMGLFGDDF